MSDEVSGRTIGLAERVNYQIDRQISTGTVRLLLWLSAFSIAVVSFAALFLALGVHPEGGESEGYVESFWVTLNLAMDPGGIEDSGWAYRAVMILVSIFGILIVSTIIGVLTSGIEGKLDELRRGRSLVIERDHTVILGWSTKIAAAVRELVEANASHRRAVIVILADLDKVEMEEYIRAQVTDLGTTEVICRRGDPCDQADLELVRPEVARSILLFADEGADGDALVFKRAMALSRMLGSRLDSTAVVAEVLDADNRDAMQSIGGIELVEPAQLIVRIIVQAARQPGLSAVYEELLSFEGSEVYLHPSTGVVGRTFRDAVMSFESAMVIGLVDADGSIILNPPPDREVPADGGLVMVARDDSEIGAPIGPLAFDTSSVVTPETLDPPPEHYLVLGWHSHADIILRELGSLLSTGSRIDIVYDPDHSEGPDVDRFDEIEGISITVSTGTTSSRSLLEGIDIASVNEIMVLGYRDRLDAQGADSQTLLTLVHLRAIVAASGREVGIATELLDARNRALADQGMHDDFIASEEIVSDLMVQLSESPGLSAVFDELLTSEGSEFYLRKATDYVAAGTEAPFGLVVQAGLDRNEIPIGMLSRNREGAEAGLRLAFEKSSRVRFGADDWIVVLADD